MMELAPDILFTWVQNFGFPVVVALFFMFRTEKVIKANTDALMQVKEVIGRCNPPKGPGVAG